MLRAGDGRFEPRASGFGGTFLLNDLLSLVDALVAKPFTEE